MEPDTVGLATGTLLDGRYSIIRLIGSGGFGQTYLAEDTKLPTGAHNSYCVVKQLKPEKVNFQVAARLFEQEAQTLGKLGKNDQIPSLLAHLTDQDNFFLILEWVDGHDLSDELKAQQPLTEQKTRQLLIEILSVLKVVHDEGVIHRDIKPSNIMRRQADGKIVLIDFGAVKKISQLSTNNVNTISSRTIGIGTQGYMPPEQRAGHPSLSSDIYAVGMMGIQALTGVSNAELMNFCNPTTGEYEWRNGISVSPELANIIDKMVRYDFRQRYQNAAEALQAIQSLNAGQSNVPRTLTYQATVPAKSGGTTTPDPTLASTIADPNQYAPSSQPPRVYLQSTPMQGSVTGGDSEKSKSSVKWLLAGGLILVVLSLVGGVAATLYIQSLIANGNEESSPISSPIPTPDQTTDHSTPPPPTPTSETSSPPPISNPETVSAALIDVEPLRQALQEQQFKNADTISKDLFTELLGVNPTISAIEKMPCPDLLRIDQVWVEGSGGRFGLSPQLAIWQRISANTPDVSEAFIAFVEKIGWRYTVTIGYRTRSLSELTYSSLAVEGHLPSGMFFEAEDRSNYFTPYILQRLAFCQSQQAVTNPQ